MKGTAPSYLTQFHLRRCRNCLETSRTLFGLCPICRKPLKVGMLVGGVIVGVMFKVIEHFTW